MMKNTISVANVMQMNLKENAGNKGREITNFIVGFKWEL